MNRRRRTIGQLRSETATVRLDPRLRYLAELAARKQRRSLSAFVMNAVADSLANVKLSDGRSVAEAGADLWDPDEAERFRRLATLYPELLTYEEQVRWKQEQEKHAAAESPAQAVQG